MNANFTVSTGDVKLVFTATDDKFDLRVTGKTEALRRALSETKLFGGLVQDLANNGVIPHQGTIGSGGFRQATPEEAAKIREILSQAISARDRKKAAARAYKFRAPTKSFKAVVLKDGKPTPITVEAAKPRARAFKGKVKVKDLRKAAKAAPVTVSKSVANAIPRR